MDASKHIHKAQNKARDVSHSQTMTILARLGYLSKGIVYLIIGFFALRITIGGGGKATDQRGAIHLLHDELQPWGTFLLIILIIGLLGFAIWSLMQCFLDTDGLGKKIDGIIGRAAHGILGISYASLAYGAFQVFTGTGTGGKSTSQQTEDWTTLLLKQPFGVVLVILVGLIILGIAGYLIYKAISAQFKRRLDIASLSHRMHSVVIALGRIGYLALSVVFLVIGICMIIAALKHDADDVKGLDSALPELLRQPFGPVLFTVCALGLFIYGIYSLVEARYRRVGAQALR